jgi:hypothetical protein
MQIAIFEMRSWSKELQGLARISRRDEIPQKQETPGRSGQRRRRMKQEKARNNKPDASRR